MDQFFLNYGNAGNWIPCSWVGSVNATSVLGNPRHSNKFVTLPLYSKRQVVDTHSLLILVVHWLVPEKNHLKNRPAQKNNYSLNQRAPSYNFQDLKGLKLQSDTREVSNKKYCPKRWHILFSVTVVFFAIACIHVGVGINGLTCYFMLIELSSTGRKPFQICFGGHHKQTNESIYLEGKSSCCAK